MSSRGFLRGRRQWNETLFRIARMAERTRRHHHHAGTNGRANASCAEPCTFRTAYIFWTLGCLAEIVSKRFDMLDAGILCFSAGNLFKSPPGNTRPVSNRLPMTLSGFKIIQHEFVNRLFHAWNSKPFFGFAQPANGSRDEILLQDDR